MLAAIGFFYPSTPTVIMMGVLLIGGFFRSLEFTSVNALAYADIEAAVMSRATSFSSVAQQLSFESRRRHRCERASDVALVSGRDARDRRFPMGLHRHGSDFDERDRVLHRLARGCGLRPRTRLGRARQAALKSSRSTAAKAARQDVKLGRPGTAGLRLEVADGGEIALEAGQQIRPPRRPAAPWRGRSAVRRQTPRAKSAASWRGPKTMRK